MLTPKDANQVRTMRQVKSYRGYLFCPGALGENFGELGAEIFTDSCASQVLQIGLGIQNILVLQAIERSAGCR